MTGSGGHSESPLDLSGRQPAVWGICATRGGTQISLYLSLPLLVGVALVQSAWLSRISVLGARPDLMLLAVLIWAVLRGRNEGLLWAFVGGLLTDLLSSGGLGIYVLALIIVALLAGQAWGRALGSSFVRMLVLAVGAGLAYHLVVLLALSYTGRTMDWAHAVLATALPSIALNVVLAPLVWILLSWVDRRTRVEGFGR